MIEQECMCGSSFPCPIHNERLRRDVTFELNPRRTGRTTRMLREVARRADAGERVGVLVMTRRFADTYCAPILRSFCNNPGNVEFFTPEDIGRVRGRRFDFVTEDHTRPASPQTLVDRWWGVRSALRESLVWNSFR